MRVDESLSLQDVHEFVRAPGKNSISGIKIAVRLMSSAVRQVGRASGGLEGGEAGKGSGGQKSCGGPHPPMGGVLP